MPVCLRPVGNRVSKLVSRQATSQPGLCTASAGVRGWVQDSVHQSNGPCQRHAGGHTPHALSPQLFPPHKALQTTNTLKAAPLHTGS